MGHSPPPGCLQYHTGVDGRFETFNFPGNSPVMQHLRNQDYRICIRQEEGRVYSYIIGISHKMCPLPGITLLSYHSFFIIIFQNCFSNTGYCCVDYRVCDETNPFTLAEVTATQTMAKHGALCVNDWVEIEGMYGHNIVTQIKFQE